MTLTVKGVTSNPSRTYPTTAVSLSASPLELAGNGMAGGERLAQRDVKLKSQRAKRTVSRRRGAVDHALKGRPRSIVP
jgi:hypothetical protein